MSVNSNQQRIEIFGLSASKNLTEKLCKKINHPVGEISIQRFADGEILVKPLKHVRGKDVILIQSVSTPVNEHLMELLIAIDSMKRASARSVIVIVPYFGYSRQDRKSKPREPITFKLIANLIERAGANKILTWDIHSAQTQGFFDITFDSIEAVWVLLKAFVEKTKISSELTIVSPDYGGVKRARDISIKLNLPLAIIDKRRPHPNSVEICNILGNVKNRDCIIVDDMIDTGGTMIAASKLLKKKGAKSVSIIATHALLNGNAIENLRKAKQKQVIDHIYVTDTIEREPLDFLEVVTITDQLKGFYEIYKNGTGSMSDVMNAPTDEIIDKLKCIVSGECNLEVLKKRK